MRRLTPPGETAATVFATANARMERWLEIRNGGTKISRGLTSIFAYGAGVSEAQGGILGAGSAEGMVACLIVDLHLDEINRGWICK